jgi:RNA polymerase sigma-70 factor (ECF subfamily)
MPHLYYAADRLMHNPADAEDAVQEGLLAAFRHIDQFRGDSNLSTWLHSIVTNAARMQLRKRNRLRETSIPDDSGDTTNDRRTLFFVDRRPDPEQECARKERSRLLAERMKDLSPQARSVVQLCVIDGLLLREAAQKLGVPTGTVKARLHRARKLLANALRRHEFRVCNAFRPNQIA